MRFKRREKSHLSAINLTPLIDVVFLLVVFFMLTTKFMSYKAIEMELGGASSGGGKIEERTPQKQGMHIIVHGNKHVEVNGYSMSIDNLRSYLKPRIQQNRNQTIVIEPSKGILVQDVVSAIDQVRLSGARRFTIAGDGNYGG